MCEGGGFPPERLAAALAELPSAAWSLASTYSETRVHHGYRRAVLVSAGQLQPHADLFGFVWREFEPVWDSWLSWIDPGGFIVPHRDPGPWRQRWQVPIAAAGQWSTPDTVFDPTPGVAFPVRHWESHAVTNRTDRPRIHLVIDRDVLIDRDPMPFTTYPIPNDLADLIERTHQ